MLKSLRLKLTLLYLLVAMILVSLVGGSSYSMLYYYLQTTNDTALKYKMAVTFESIGAALPSELKTAEQEWRGQHVGLTTPISSGESDDENNNKTTSGKPTLAVQTSGSNPSESYEGELSTIFVLPLDSSGNLLFNPNPYTPPISPDLTAIKAAIAAGVDLRTIRTSDGTPVRLLTYSLPKGTGFDVIQLGRPFGDQVRVMNQFLTGLLLIGAIGVLVLGVGSWWMAGKSLTPTQRAWENQQIFIANASHELRTPLTLIRASSEVALRHTPDDTEEQSLLTDVIKECDHMTQIVEDLLLLSRLDARQLKMERQLVSMPELIGEVQREFARLAESQPLQIKAEDLNGEVIGDRTRLRQVLLILLDNALRHTPPGGEIGITSVIEGRAVRVSVTDTGEGIPREHLAHVFDRFYQVINPRSEVHRGSGLGLSIAKSLVESQQGQITVTSVAGKGTTVSFVLPAARMG